MRKNFNILTLSVFTFSILLVNNTSGEELKGKKNLSEKKVRFIVTGDTGTGGKGQYLVASAIEEKCKKSGCDFGILLGDNIYNNGVENIDDPQFITKFEKPYQSLDFKLYLILGNHDYRGNIQAQIDYTGRSKKWNMPGSTYSFSKDMIDFFAIDTNRPDKKQQTELISLLENSKAKWKIVFGHHPRYTNSVYKGKISPAITDMLDNALCNRADLYLAGHEHDKQHLKAVCGVEHLILGSGAGIRLSGYGENTLFAKSSLGFGWFEADHSKIFFQVMDTSGNVEYEYTIR